MSTSTVGAWSAWNFTLSAEAKNVFAAATKGLLGVSYTAEAYASQVVSGMNYSFLCFGRTSTNPSLTYPVLMHVYAPLGGEPSIQGIEQLGPEVNGLPGGYSSWNVPATADGNKVLAEALSGMVGVSYRALGDSKQVVSGANYCFLCSGTVVTAQPVSIATLVYVYQPLNGAPHVSQIVRIEPK